MSRATIGSTGGGGIWIPVGSRPAFTRTCQGWVVLPGVDQVIIPWTEPGSQFTACAKGHRYLTVVTVLERNRVLYLTEGCKQESLDGF
ncbi:MAG: hypothetical protein AB7G48_13060 [Nitrospiraceae bacterium]